MTFAEREQIAAATENCRKLAEEIARLNGILNDLRAHADAETERRMDLSQRVTALENKKPSTLTLGGRRG